MKRITALFVLLLTLAALYGQKVEPLPFGDFNSWVTREIKESRLIGGDVKKCYAIGPTRTITGDKPYTGTGGSPWATSNVMAKVMGITKVSNKVYPHDRGNGNKCAMLCTGMEHCQAIGIIDIDVVVAGTIFLGRMIEPIKSTSNPYQKMEMGIPFTGRPPYATIICWKSLPTPSRPTAAASARSVRFPAATRPKCSSSCNGAGKIPTGTSMPRE